MPSPAAGSPAEVTAPLAEATTVAAAPSSLASGPSPATAGGAPGSCSRCVYGTGSSSGEASTRLLSPSGASSRLPGAEPAPPAGWRVADATGGVAATPSALSRRSAAGVTPATAGCGGVHRMLTVDQAERTAALCSTRFSAASTIGCGVRSPEGVAGCLMWWAGFLVGLVVFAILPSGVLTMLLTAASAGRSSCSAAAMLAAMSLRPAAGSQGGSGACQADIQDSALSVGVHVRCMMRCRPDTRNRGKELLPSTHR